MVPYVKYLPVSKRKPDSQYKRLLRRIRREGVWFDNQMDEPAKTIFGVKLDFPLKNGAPIITERDIVTPGKNGRSYVGQAIGETVGFINGAHTHAQLEKYGCHWWKNWVSEEKCAKRGLETGDLGPGSYGMAWTHFPSDEGGFNQIDALLAQIFERPHLRTHLITPWIPQFVFRANGYDQKVVVVPCHGWVNVRINTKTNGMTVIMHQRSADIPVGFPANMAGYLSFALMLAQISNYTAERLIFMIDDAHYYKSQIDSVERLLSTDDEILPTVLIADNDYEQITDYRSPDFLVSDYRPTGPRMLIPTPV